MELDRLTIRNFRGIRGTEEFEPQGEHLALVGPNGSGKSSVVSAVDFLLNGSIEPLRGEGTKGITEKQHGPHVDADPGDAWVEAEFSSNGESITVRRSLDDRNNPEYDGSNDRVLRRYKELEQSADRGLHLLSRNEILQFITSTGQTRSKRIRSLLNINHVRERRLVLKNARDDLQSTLDSKKREIESHEDQLVELLGLDEYNESRLLSVVNEYRTQLGGDEIDTLEAKGFRRGIDSPSEQVRFSPVHSSDGRQHAETIREWLNDGVEHFLAADAEFREAWNELDPDEEALLALQREELYELGKDTLQPDEGRCPLCHEPWDPDELEQHLEDQLAEVHELSEKKQELETLAHDAQQLLTDIRVTLDSFRELVEQDDQFGVKPLEAYLNTIHSWEDQYDEDIFSEPPRYGLSEDERLSVLKPSSFKEWFENVEDELEEAPEFDAIEDAWESLGAAQTRFGDLQETREQVTQYRDATNQLEVIHQSYIDARDSVLGEIYAEIEDHFVDYYTELHQDESDLSVDLSTTTAGLDLDVEFYNRGTHPPHALHSEGHQDSMGICLHFALSDWLREETGHPLIMLDDVVMSIDAEHRKPMAKMLGSQLSDRYQLIITTHDDLWHRHLRSEGVLTSANAVRFVDWSIEDGPSTMDRPEMEWESIYALLDEGKVPSAAFQTRRMAEWYLREACDRLDAKVRFKSDSNWTIGDFEEGVKPRLKELLGKAKTAEQSWGNDIDDLNKLDDTLSDLFQDLDRHGPALNPNVHWNEAESEFAHCSPEELRPAVEAYHDFFEQLWCSNCDSPISVLKQDLTETAVRCRCKQIDWNLTAKSDS